MKYFSIVLTALFLTNCNPDKSIIDNKNSIIDTSSTTETLGIIGEWLISRTISQKADNIMEIACNSCPRINFKNDNTAVLTKPTGDKENLQWKINNNKIALTNINRTHTDSVYFDNAQYEMTFTNKKEYMELKLTLTEKNYSYILGR